MGIRMTNIATPMPQPRAKFTSKLGIPLSGCKVYTYEPNSNILKATWLDIDKTAENTNPILLDAAGEADIFLDGLYRIVVKDRFGFVVYDVEKTGYEQPILDYSDTKLITWSGRTQEQKNKDILSFEDFLDPYAPTMVANALDSKRTLTLRNEVYDMGNAKFLMFTPENSNVVINGNGATLKFSDSSYIGGSRIQLIGSKIELPAIKMDINVNSNQIIFTDKHNLKIGDLVSVQSDRLVEYSEGATQRYIGELLTVAKIINETTVISHESTVYAYLINMNSKAYKYIPVENVVLKDLTIEDAGLDPLGLATENQKPINLEYTKNCKLKNIKIKNACGQQISIKNSYGWSVDDCNLEQEQIDDIDTWAQYGVSVVDFSRKGVVNKLQAKGFKTAISFTDSGAGYGMAINTMINGVQADNCSRIISMHATTRDLQVYDVEGDSCTRGMNIRCANVKVRNFNMKRSKNFQGQGSMLFMLSNVVRDLDIADVSIDGGFNGISTTELGSGYAHENISIKRANFKNIQDTVLNLDFSTGSLSEAKGFELSDITFDECRGARLILKGNFLKPIITDMKLGDAEIGAIGCNLFGTRNGIFKRNDFGANLLPFNFSDLTPSIKSLNNLLEDNTWERDSGIATGTSQQYIVGRSNTRTVIGGNHITDLTNFEFRIAEGTRYLTCATPNGSLRNLVGGNTGDIVSVRSVSGILTLQGTGNIKLKSGEVILNSPDRICLLLCVGQSWLEV